MTPFRGQTLVEYGLLLALVAAIVITGLVFLGPIVSQIFKEDGASCPNASQIVIDGRTYCQLEENTVIIRDGHAYRLVQTP